MKLNFQKCCEKDVQLLSKISRETFIDTFEKQNDPTDFKDYISEAFSIETIHRELSNAASHFFFIYIDRELIGYFKLNEFDAQTELNEKKGIELERIYIIKEYQGKSLGREALLKVVEMAIKKDKEYIWLGVWEHNLDAIRFYKRNGFIKFDTHPYYIGSDKQTDWLMRKEL